MSEGDKRARVLLALGMAAGIGLAAFGIVRPEPGAAPSRDGAIAVVRLSGDEARDILARLTADHGREARSHQMRVAKLFGEDGAVLDEAMIVEMMQPGSYTGEDVVELHLHGSGIEVQSVIERTFENISAADRHKIVYQNAADLYGLTG